MSSARDVNQELLDIIYVAEDFARQGDYTEAKEQLGDFLFHAECYALQEMLMIGPKPKGAK